VNKKKTGISPCDEFPIVSDEVQAPGCRRAPPDLGSRYYNAPIGTLAVINSQTTVYTFVSVTKKK